VLRKKPRERGKLSLGKLLRGYEKGEKVVIKIDPSVHHGMPHRRYHGKVGEVVGQRGRAYLVKIPQRKTFKLIITTPEHLAPHPSGGRT